RRSGRGGAPEGRRVGGLRLVSPGALARTIAPVAFLAVVTIAVLAVRSGLGGAAGPEARVRPHMHRTAETAGRRQKAKPAKAAPVSAAYYRIQSGDTLGAVAQHFVVPLDKLFALNPGIEPTALHVGQRVRIR